MMEGMRKQIQPSRKMRIWDMKGKQLDDVPEFLNQLSKPNTSTTTTTTTTTTLALEQQQQRGSVSHYWNSIFFASTRSSGELSRSPTTAFGVLPSGSENCRCADKHLGSLVSVEERWVLRRRSNSRHSNVCGESGDSVGVSWFRSVVVVVLFSLSTTTTVLSAASLPVLEESKFNRFRDRRLARRELPGGESPNFGGVLQRVMSWSCSSLR